MKCNSGSGSKALIGPQLERAEAEGARESPCFGGFNWTQSHAT